MQCTPGLTPIDGHWTVQSGPSACVQALDMDASASPLLDNSVVVDVLAFEGAGTVSVQIAAGCTTESGTCPECTFCIKEFTGADAGQLFVLPLASTSKPQLVVTYALAAADVARAAPRDAALRATAGPDFTIDFRVQAYPSFAVGVFLLSATLVLLPCCCLAIRQHWKRKPSLYRSNETHVRVGQPVTPRWPPRWRSLWVRLGTGGGLCLLLLGLVWVVTLLCLHRSSINIAGPVWVGVAMAAAGLTAAGAVGLYALRIPPDTCPVCWEPTSSWFCLDQAIAPLRVAGPPETWHCKGHRDCLKCVACGWPVRGKKSARWAAAPPTRPYHATCWEEECARAMADAGRLGRFCAAEGVTDCELAHLLAATITTGNHQRMRELLALRPDLQAFSLPDWPSARHCAAAVANLPALRALVDAAPGPLDLACPVDKAQGSLQVWGRPRVATMTYNRGAGGQRPKKKHFVYLKSTSNFGPPLINFIFFLRTIFLL